MPDIVQGQIGPETMYDVAFTGGALTVSMKYAGTEANLALTGSISAAQLIAALDAKITNPVEKALVGGLQAIIASIP